MGEGLREIAEGGARGDVDLLAIEPEIVGMGEHVLEAPLGSVELAALGEIVDRPETADAERTLDAIDAVEPLVAIQQAVAAEPLVDPVVGRAHAWITRVLV